jgi:hypothetical protein
MNAAIVGEDQVTREIIKKLISIYAPHLTQLNEIPARGSQALNAVNVERYNKLALSIPVILLTDLDDTKKQEILHDIEQNPLFIINVAVEEAEAWLMADKNNFISYFCVEDKIPNAQMCRMHGRNERIETIYEYKPSLYMMREIISTSTKLEVQKQLTPKEGAKKGPEYNTAMTPFIQEVWNPENARLNSYSLDKMIYHLQSIH